VGLPEVRDSAPLSLLQNRRSNSATLDLNVTRPWAWCIAAAVLVFAVAASLGRPPEPQAFGDAVHAGQIENSEIDEASGLAASRRRSDLLWTHNDSGAVPRLYAVGVDGRDHGAVDLRGASSVDWEDLAAFEIDGVPYLLIADTGDNDAERKSVMLYIVEEPELRGDRFEDGAAVSVAWSLEVVFEDGPMDCEGVAVDVPGQRILFVSKWTVPLRLYEIPLHPSGSEVRSPAVATRVAEIANIPQPTNADREEDPKFGQFRSQTTALDVTADASELLLVTYANAYRFERAAGEGWLQAVSRPGERLAIPLMAQTEAGAYALDG
jgi:hypothetical protein